MPSNSILTLKKYIVKHVDFNINARFVQQEGPINLQPEFQRQIKKIDNDTAIVNLLFRIIETPEHPFSMDINIEGVFMLTNWENEDTKELMVSNTVAILFPYLRSLVTMITANANIPPYTLPVMNISELFAQSKDNVD